MSGYFIYYPKLADGQYPSFPELKVTKHPESWMDYTFAFSEGPLKSKDEVIKRLNEMDVPIDKRPKGFKCQPGYVQIAKACIRKK